MGEILMGRHGGGGEILGRRRAPAESEMWESTDCTGGRANYLVWGESSAIGQYNITEGFE